MKHNLTLLLFILGVFAPLRVFSGEHSEAAPIKLDTLELTDGRKLKNVIVKSYNASTAKLLIVADGKATVIPLAIVPAPLQQQMKSAPVGGAFVNVVTPPIQPVRPPEHLQEPFRIDTSPRIRVNGPAPGSGLQPTSLASPMAGDSSAAESARLGQHQKVARTRAERYFRYEFPAGSGSVSVTALDIDLSMPKAVPGYPSRVEVSGKAYLEYLETKGGGSIQRATSLFEITTEETAAAGITVLSFNRKS